MGAPSGLVTLLFTDIEGSTRAWEAHPAEMRIALQRHDEILRAEIEDEAGYVFKTVGDAFCAAFVQPAQAVRAAVSVQRALACEPWPEQIPIRVRMGVHSGVCQERDGDYFGPTVNRTARLQGTAYGGQVVVSGSTAGVLAGELPAELSLRDLGEHRLKDLGRPEHVYQVCGDGLACDFPALQSLDSPELIHNLPSQVSTFVGRERELEELRKLLSDSRVVTLTGAGGVGKTRLALQLAADLLDGSGDGVWFVDLAPLSDPGLVAAKAASALGVREEPGRPVQESLVLALKSRRLLIVLDNCEHVVGDAARLVDELAKGCPGVAVVSTSREPLRVPGEHVYRVPSLSVPAGDEDDPDALLASEAVRLFLERAGDQQSGVALDAENAAVLARLCRRLDGIPLALELAAARLRSLSLIDLERRLDQRLRLLTAGSRTALPRQQTLEAMIDWSYDLLAPLEQELLDKLSVFAGGFDLDATDAVVRSRTQSSLGILDRLAALVDKSLVETERTEMLRYRLLESVRQYAVAKLAARGEGVVRAVHAAHRDHYLALAETAAPHLVGHGQFEWLDRLEVELDNLRAAMTFCLDDPDPAPGLRLVCALRYFWNYREPGTEGGAATCQALDRSAAEQPTLVRGRALVGAAVLLSMIGEHERAAARGTEALGIAAALSDQWLHAAGLYAGAVVTGSLGDVDAHFAITTEALDAARKLEDPHLTAEILLTRAASVRLTHAERTLACEECLALCQTVGNRVMYVRALDNLGYAQLYVGEIDAARVRFDEALRLAREMGDQYGLSLYACNLGFAWYLNGNDTEASPCFDEAMRVAQRNGDLTMVAYAKLGAALLASRAGDPRAAASLHGTADAIHDRLGSQIQEVESRLREADIARLGEELGDLEFQAAYDAGRATQAGQFDVPIGLARERLGA